MEKGQSEVTSKIRTAIKEKLAEISDFVDDELPEYIMILVANQRSKAQIEKDLSLFLRNDSVVFTNWLWQLLSNLKVSSKGSQSSHVKSDSGLPKKREAETDEDAVVLDCDPDEREGDFLIHDDTNDSIHSAVPRTTAVTCVQVKKETLEEPQQTSKAFEKEKKLSQLPEKLAERPFKTHQSRSNKGLLSSAVVNMRKRIVNSDDEYDPAKPEFLSSSRTHRKYSGPAALQANKLLQKAVDDATKSILVGKNIEDYYKPTPIKVLTSKRYGNLALKKDDSVLYKKNSQYEIFREPHLNVNEPDISDLNESKYSDILMQESYRSHSVSPQKNRTIRLRTVPLSSSIELESDQYSPNHALLCPLPPIDVIRPKSPHFIVTLEGVNPSSLKRKLEDSSTDSMEEDEEENIDDNVVEDIINNTSSEKKLKLSERCKYWPACKNSEHCPYHHPTVPCKSFPDCKFGDKCLYIHPNCKFDALCSRKDCPYTHVSKRKVPLVPVPVRIPVKSRKLKTVCKFYPKCTSKNCQFIHPKLCRYGTDCRLPVCAFSHFPIPSRSQLRWQASVT